MTENSDYKYCVTVEIDVPDSRDQNEIESHAGDLASLHLEDSDSAAQNNPQVPNEERHESHAIFYIENELCNNDHDDNPFLEKSADNILFISDHESSDPNEPFNNDHQETKEEDENICSDENDEVPQFQVVYSDEEKYSDNELPDSLVPCLPGERRGSKWSATILFVASEVQLIIDLAEFCPPEGYLTGPSKV